MDRPVLLFVHDRDRPMARASHHWIAVEEGFRPIVAGWRQIAAAGAEVELSGGHEILGPGLRRSIQSGERFAAAAVLHRKLVWGRSGALLRTLAAVLPRAVHSFHPAWRSISFKWACEEAFREAEADGVTVARPRTYLATRSHLGDVLEEAGRRIPLIFKPSAGSMCHGIRISTPGTFDGVVSELRRSAWTYFVVQELVLDPVLYEGRKVDLRLYVLITSFHPLRLELFSEGVARIAASAFDPTRADDGPGALTGCSYRKRRRLSTFNLSATQVIAYLAEHGVATDAFWSDARVLAERAFGALARRISPAIAPPRRFYLGGVDLLPCVRRGRLELLFLETNYYPQLNAWGDAVDERLRVTHRGWLRSLRGLCA